MAKVKFGITVVGIMGTLGGITFSRNPAGPHARIYSRGPNPQTALQNANRGRITPMGALWSSMSDVDRAAWTAFGLAPPETDTNSLGEIYYLTGFQWLVRVNQRRQSVGLDTTATLPSDAGVTPPASCTITAAPLPTGPIELSWPAATFPAGYSAVAFIGAHPTVGLAVKNSGLFLALAAHEPGDDPADLTAPIAAKLGNLPATWKLFAHLYKLRDDGVRSVAAVATCEVA